MLIKEPLVTTDVPLPKLDSSDITVQVKLQNLTAQPEKGVLKGSFGELTFEQPVEIDSNSTKQVTLDPTTTPQLHLKNPKLWWPNGFGPQRSPATTAAAAGCCSRNSTGSVEVEVTDGRIVGQLVTGVGAGRTPRPGRARFGGARRRGGLFLPRPPAPRAVAPALHPQHDSLVTTWILLAAAARTPAAAPAAQRPAVRTAHLVLTRRGRRRRGQGWYLRPRAPVHPQAEFGR